MHRFTQLPARGVYAITDGPRADLIASVRGALAGGVAILQYRDKTTDARRRRDEAAALLDACRENHIPLIINDDVKLAADIGADGVHLGEDDAAIASARDTLGAEAIIGASCYNSLERARDLAAAGADYLAFGAFFRSSTKPNARVATTALLSEARSFNLPLAAIGGITPQNATPLIDAGANFIAVVSGIFSARDVQAAARSYAELFQT